MIKTCYLWTKQKIQRLEIFTSDLNRKPEFKSNRLAEIHQRILDKRKKRNER